ncbi:MAG: lysylphosphatidylglycerol synthase transmembrane domain-containing protein [Proteobacteria bacterium]|nr:lysylphosphatidylglycerol synthase transmembrane domain-containing protein [Pseudomonadota bacterium]
MRPKSWTSILRVLRNRKFLFSLKFVFSAAMIWLVAHNIDFDDAIGRFAQLTASAVLLFAALVFVLIVNNTMRWKVVLSAIGASLPFGKAFTLNLIGLFFNQTLPSSVGGDAVRIYLAYKHGLTLTSAINGVMLDRVTSMCGLILLALVGQFFLFDRIGDRNVGLVFSALAVAAVAGVVVLMFLDRFPGRIRHWRLVSGLAKLSRDTKMLFSATRYSVFAVTLGSVGFILISLMVFVIAQALNIGVTVFDCLLLVPPVMLTTAIPLSIAGWGVREGAMVFAFGLIGVPTSDALILSVLARIIHGGRMV